MKTLTVEIPDFVDENAQSLRRFLAAKLYESGKLSLGYAAEMSQLSKRAFIEILADYGVSIFNAPEEDYLADIKYA